MDTLRSHHTLKEWNWPKHYGYSLECDIIQFDGEVLMVGRKCSIINTEGANSRFLWNISTYLPNNFMFHCHRNLERHDWSWLLQTAKYTVSPHHIPAEGCSLLSWINFKTQFYIHSYAQQYYCAVGNITTSTSTNKENRTQKYKIVLNTSHEDKWHTL
jgi:hypothetical protein